MFSIVGMHPKKCGMFGGVLSHRGLPNPYIDGMFNGYGLSPVLRGNDYKRNNPRLEFRLLKYL